MRTEIVRFLCAGVQSRLDASMLSVYVAVQRAFYVG